MNNLEDRIPYFKDYEKRFAGWEASEIIIDDEKAFWMLKDPTSTFQKVCLFRDGCYMYVYGDYGNFSFDSMTWKGSVYNLQFNNPGYQMEKLDRASREALSVFNDNILEKDVLEWAEETLADHFNLDEETTEKIVQFIKDRNNGTSWVDDFCENNGLEEIEDFLEFVMSGLECSDENEWISFLRTREPDLSQYDEACESSLWNAGKTTDPRYFINMYALKLCGEKLTAQKGENNEQ